MYIFDIKSKNQLDAFFKSNDIAPTYPKEYPCKIVFEVHEGARNNSVDDYQFIYPNQAYLGVEDFDIDKADTCD